MVTLEPGLDLLDPVQVDDGGTVDAGEPFRVELLLQVPHRLADQVSVGAGMQDRVVAFRFHPVDLVYVDEIRAAPALH